MTPALLTTKLYIPPSPSRAILRPDLMRRLDAGLTDETRLILISAPAGYGKTTLLAQWARATGLPVCWLSLDEGENDPGRFFAYFLAGLQKAVPGLGLAAALLEGPQPVDPAALLPELVNALDRLAQPLLIVLDDYQVIHTLALHTALVTLVDRLPPGIHLAIASRSDPPLPLHRYRSRGQLVELRLEALRFSPAELDALLDQADEIRLEPAERQILAERTEGWAAGILMALLSLPGKPDPGRFIRSLAGSQRYIMDYLVEEALNAQPEAVQRFLLATSVLERLAGPLCDTLLEGEAGGTGGPGSAAILETLERLNLFLIPLDDERRWYRYHHLFLDLLRMRLKSAASPAAIQDLHRRAAAWYAANARPGEAVHHALQAGDYKGAAGLVERHTEALFAQGDLHQLIGWIQALPTEVARRSPVLCLAQAWAMAFAGRVEAVEPLIAQAQQAMDGQPLSIEERRGFEAEILGVRGLTAISSGDLPTALALADLPAEALPEDHPFARSVVRWSIGFALRTLGRPAEAIPYFKEVQALGERMANPWTVTSAAVDLGNALRLTGRLPEAVATYRQGLAWVAAAGYGGSGYVGRLESFLSSALYEQDALEEAHSLALQSIAHNRLWQNPNHVAHAYWALSRVLAAQGDLAGASEALQKAQQPALLVPPLQAAIEAHQVRVWLLAGNLDAALGWMEAHPPLAVGTPIDETAAARVIPAARILMTLGRHVEARRLLERVEALPGVRLEALVLRSLAEAEPGRAQEALLKAATLAAPQNCRRVFLDEGPALHMLLGQLGPGLAGAPQAGWIAGLFAAEPEVEPNRPKPAGPLTGRELEILREMAEGLSNLEIGRRLYISAGTVKAHSAAIYRKLEVANRSEAIARAKDLGLI